MSEIEPLVSVHYSFGAHDYKALRYFPQIQAQAEGFFRDHRQAQNSIYIEDAHMTPEQFKLVGILLERRESLVNAVPLALLLDKMHLPVGMASRLKPTVQQINSRLLVVDPINETDPSIVQDESIFGVHQRHMIDKLRTNFKEEVTIDVRYETRRTREIKAQDEERNLYEKLEDEARNHMLTGDPEKAGQFYLEYLTHAVAYTTARNNTFLNDLSMIVTRAVSAGQRTRRWINVGSEHDTLFVKTQGLLEELVPGEYSLTVSYYEGKPVKYLSSDLAFRMETEPGFTPTYAQALRALSEEVIGIVFLGHLDVDDPKRVDSTKLFTASLTDDEVEDLIRSFREGNPVEQTKKLVGPKIES